VTSVLSRPTRSCFFFGLLSSFFPIFLFADISSTAVLPLVLVAERECTVLDALVAVSFVLPSPPGEVRDAAVSATTSDFGRSSDGTGGGGGSGSSGA
jgi:hypothetical protein